MGLRRGCGEHCSDLPGRAVHLRPEQFWWGTVPVAEHAVHVAVVGGWGTLLSEFGTEAGTSSSITSGTIASGDYAAHLFGHESTSTITNSGSPSGYTERAQLNFSIVTAQGIWGDAPGAGGTLTFTNSRGSGVDYAEMIVPIQAATVTSGMLAMF